MSDAFSPYREWLGIEDGRQPATFYELLGIASDETDPAIIGQKADSLTARIRKIRPGPHIAAWQQLLDTLARAKTCLLDPASRAAYDASLRAGAAPPTVVASSSPPLATLAQPPGLAGPVAVSSGPAVQAGPPVPTIGTPLAAGPAAPTPASEPPAPQDGVSGPLPGPPMLFPEPGQGVPGPPVPAPPAYPSVPPAPSQLPGQPPFWVEPMPQAPAPSQYPGAPYYPAGIPPEAPAPLPGMEMPSEPAADPLADLSTAPEWLDNPGAAIEPQPQAWAAAPSPAPMPPAWSSASSPVPPGAVPATPMHSAMAPAAAPSAPDAVDPGFLPAQGDYRPAPVRTTLSQTVLRALTILVLGLAGVFGFLFWKQRQESGRNSSGEDPSPIVRVDLPSDPERKPEPGKSADPSSSPGKEPGQPAKPPEKKPEENAKPAEKTDPGEQKTSTGDDPSKPEEKRTPEPPADPAKRESLRRALTGVRAAMARRDLPAARQQLKTALASAQGEADEAQVARTETLLANLEEFWKGMSLIVSELKPLQEISLGNTQGIVVTADRGSVTYRSEGRNHTYTLKDMPVPVVMSLARDGFAKAASQKVLLGTFLAVDANGDPKQARRLWEEAARQGEDVKELLAELNLPGGPVDPAVPKKPAPTDPAALKKAKDAMHRQFQADFDQASNAAGKAALARKLLDAGLAADAESRFVLFGEARSQAVAAGRASLACEAVDQLASHYAIDGFALKIAALEELVKSARSLPTQKETADSAVKAAAQALQSQRQEQANRLAELAIAVARKSRNAALIRSVQAALQQAGTAQPGAAEEKDE